MKSKRIFIIHGWDGHPNEGWFPWLKKELETKGFEVQIPQLPNADVPRIEKWIPELIRVAKDPNENTYFIGHSMGCQAIARYLERLPENICVGGAVFVAGFFKQLTNLGNDAEVKSVEKEWLETPIDFKKVKEKISKSIAIFSDNDPYVPLKNQNDFKEKLGSKIIIEHSMKHFSGSTGTTELPIALESILEISS